MEKEIRYFNFPIQLIRGASVDISKVCWDIICHSLYKQALAASAIPKEEDIKRAADYYRVPILETSIKTALKNGRTLYDSIPSRSPIAGISSDVVLDYRQNEKSEFEIACFCAYAGVKSYLGKDPYKKITNLTLLSRMSGYSSEREIQENNPIFLSLYSSRWKIDKIKSNLKMRWGVKIYSRHTRGLWVSTTMNLEELIIVAEKARKRYIEKTYKEQEEEALKRALRSVYGNKK